MITQIFRLKHLKFWILIIYILSNSNDYSKYHYLSEFSHNATSDSLLFQFLFVWLFLLSLESKALTWIAHTGCPVFHTSCTIPCLERLRSNSYTVTVRGRRSFSSRLSLLNEVSTCAHTFRARRSFPWKDD